MFNSAREVKSTLVPGTHVRTERSHNIGRSFGRRPDAGNTKGVELMTTSPPDKQEMVAAVRARQRAIGRELRRIYDDVLYESVPNDFVDLLQKADDVGVERGS